MRLIRLALAVTALSVSLVVSGAKANPAMNGGVGGTVATAATPSVGGNAQARLDGATSPRGSLSMGGSIAGSMSGSEALPVPRSSARSASVGGGMNETVPSGWLMALVTVLLIGHQLRRKHRFLRPQRFNDL